MTGWSSERHRGRRALWILASVALCVGTAGVADDEAGKLRGDRQLARAVTTAIDDLRDLIRASEDLAGSCGPVYLSVGNLAPAFSYFTGRPPGEARPMRLSARPTRGLVLVPATGPRGNIFAPQTLERTSLRRYLDKEFEVAASNARWTLYVRGCRSSDV